MFWNNILVPEKFLGSFSFWDMVDFVFNIRSELGIFANLIQNR